MSPSADRGTADDIGEGTLMKVRGCHPPGLMGTARAPRLTARTFGLGSSLEAGRIVQERGQLDAAVTIVDACASLVDGLWVCRSSERERRTPATRCIPRLQEFF